MENFKLQLTLLADILEKKKAILSQILIITENQETLLKSTEAESIIDPIFDSMNEEKQKLIDDVLSADNFFQHTFNSIGSEFEQNAPEYAESVRRMQNLIKEVMDFDIKIRVQEQNNKTYALRSQIKKKPPRPTVSKDYMINQYRKNNTQ